MLLQILITFKVYSTEKPVWDPESSSYGIFIEGEGAWICCGVKSPLHQYIKLSLVIKGRDLGSVVFVTCIHTLGPLKSLSVEKYPRPLSSGGNKTSFEIC